MLDLMLLSHFKTPFWSEKRLTLNFVYLHKPQQTIKIHPELYPSPQADTELFIFCIYYIVLQIFLILVCVNSSPCISQKLIWAENDFPSFSAVNEKFPPLSESLRVQTLRLRVY